jgi:hypothetical protein
MSSCAASCCTCFPKVSCASGTSASSPTASVPHSYHFAFICSVQHRRQNKTFQAAKPQVIFGYAQNAVTHDGHRKTHRCRNPTSFSSRPGHRGRMKRPSTTRNLCVRQRAQSLRAWPFRKSRPSTFSSLVLVPVLRFRHLFSSRYRPSCSAAQPRRISTPNLPTIEFA